MSLQLQPISTSHYYTSGNVTIQEGAAIAPGVLLQADADSRVIIGTGACIGIGSVLHARQGDVEVGEGASIGAEVLLIGPVTIGANACIGSAATVINSAIAWGQVVPPGSLVGDLSRPVQELQATDTVPYPAVAESPAPEVPVVPEEAIAASGLNVCGQVYVNQLLVKLFPHSPRNPTHSAPPTPALTEDPWDD